MTDPAIATAADYADAMISARRAKNTLVLLLLLVLLGQLAIFFVVRFTDLLTPSTEATTQPWANWSSVFHYLCGLCLFLGVALPIVLGFVLLLIVNIMLVGRLIGVRRTIGAYIWVLVLLVLLFPWQAFLNNVNLTSEQAAWKLPGVLYTWDELTHPTQGADFLTTDIWFATLKWARFAGFPLLAVLILLLIQAKSNRGMRQALGEDELTISTEPVP